MRSKTAFGHAGKPLIVLTGLAGGEYILHDLACLSHGGYVSFVICGSLARAHTDTHTQAYTVHQQLNFSFIFQKNQTHDAKINRCAVIASPSLNKVRKLLRKKLLSKSWHMDVELQSAEFN